MPEKKEPQSFSFIIADADGGTINGYLSEKFGEMLSKLQDRANLHEDTFRGEFTMKLAVIVQPNGKVEIKPACSAKLPPEKMPSARFFTDEESRLTRQDPRVASDLFEAKQRREERGPAKSAAAPGKA